MSLVESKAGKFEGLLQNECHQFFGIPYAKYNQRWGKSFLIEEEMYFKALSKGDSAPQTRSDDQSQTGTSFFQDRSLSKQSEDCLTLNICSNNIQVIKNFACNLLSGYSHRFFMSRSKDSNRGDGRIQMS